MIAEAIATLALAVAPGSSAETVKVMPRGNVNLAVTIGGRDGFYERTTPCTAYVYGRGIVGKLNTCRKAWTLRLTNTGEQRRTVKVWVYRA